MANNVIVIPTYNERENIRTLVPAIFTAVPDVSILVVDDNSPDGTAAQVRELQLRFPRLSLLERKGKEGLGRAYIHAFGMVLADLTVATVTMMDADHSHDPKYLPAMFAAIAEGASVVVGSRHMRGGATVGWELWRRVLSAGGNLYCRLITRLPIYDCTGGFNMMRADVLRRVDFGTFDLSGYAFIMELKYALWKAGRQQASLDQPRRADGAFKEIPIVFCNRVEGESKISSNIIWEGIVAPWKMIFKK